MHQANPSPPDSCQTAANTIDTFAKAILSHLKYNFAKTLPDATKDELCQSVAFAVREYLVDGLVRTARLRKEQQCKTLYVLSMEYLPGRSLGNNLLNLGLYELAKGTLDHMGIDMEELCDKEPDAQLGNGGLARLASCMLDSMATQSLPVYGHGLNYEFGAFGQYFSNGFQQEQPTRWCWEHNPWLIQRSAASCKVHIYGHIEHRLDSNGNYQPSWVETETLLGIPQDMPLVGYRTQTLSTLRLWSARTASEMRHCITQDREYYQAIRHQLYRESVSKILEPSDAEVQVSEQRLIQEYFLASCAVQDILRQYLADHTSFDAFSSLVALHINNTQPALAVVELMRLLLDTHGLSWEEAWQTTTESCSFTVHSLLADTLSTWPVLLLEKVLPRHLQIIYEINQRFLEQVSTRFPDDENAPTRMSLFDETGGKHLVVSHLAIVASHSVNGVAALHSTLLEESCFPDFYKLWPEKFNNKTNGISQRRWLLHCNPKLSALISSMIGSDWIVHPESLSRLEDFLDDRSFLEAFRGQKCSSKINLADFIHRQAGVKIDPQSLYGVQAKRIHEYKRQLLHIFYIIHSYLSIIEDRVPPAVPRTFIFAGRAAPGYSLAKLILKLIHSVADIVNRDRRSNAHLRVVMLPDYGVSLAEKIIPAADLSEQLSTAGTEASGTGNMKLCLNGALTIGTLDGATIEIMEQVGADNIFIFGHTVKELEEMSRNSSYTPMDYYANSPAIQRVMDALGSTLFCQETPGLFKDIYDTIMYYGDPYFHLADFESYISAQSSAENLYTEPAAWSRKAVLNIARSGRFSIDRTVRQYAQDIWKLQPFQPC